MKIQGQEITYQDLKHRPELWPVIEARVKALEALVARLPKTADGVPIAGDMVVWLCEEGAINPKIVWGTKWSGLCGTHILFEHESRLPGECYSTREAAEAAEEGGA